MRASARWKTAAPRSGRSKAAALAFGTLSRFNPLLADRLPDGRVRGGLRMELSVYRYRRRTPEGIRHPPRACLSARGAVPRRCIAFRAAVVLSDGAAAVDF